MARRPIVQTIGEHEFKYAIDFEALDIDEGIAAICVSRPTNPSGNVLTDEEIDRLSQLARQREIPLLIDNAYGQPFPDVVFRPAKPIWNDNLILTYSLSKLGLPGTRTGIVIARPGWIDALSSMTSIIGLANANLGQAIATPLLESGELVRISREVIRPYYHQRSEQMVGWLRTYLPADVPYRLHRSEGAFFVWLWLPGLPITTDQLYRRLKRRGVFVIPGHHFFYGDDDSPWPHRHECLRISFAMPEPIVRRGVETIADEIRQIGRVRSAPLP